MTDEDPDDKQPRIRWRRTIDWDVRGILAIMSLIGVFGLAIVQVFYLHASPEVPAWAAAIVASVTGFYFGSRAGGNGR